MTNSAVGEPWRFRNSVSQSTKTRRMQISAICESSPVVSSSGATFASSRTATRVISRPFQKRSAAKSCFAIESPARTRRSPAISAYPRDAKHTSGWHSHRSVSGFCVNLVAQMLETARRCSRDGSPSGNWSMTQTRGNAFARLPAGLSAVASAWAGHRSLSWTRAVSTCEGFNDPAAFSRIQRFPPSISQNITRFWWKDQLTRCPGLGRRQRRQNTKRFLLDLEFNRTAASQLAIELQGNVLLARYAQAASLEIFDLWSADLGAEYNVLEILNDFEIAQPFEHDHIEQAIIDDSALEKWERAAVKAPVSDQNKRSFSYRSAFRFNIKFRRLPCRNLGCRDEIA